MNLIHTPLPNWEKTTNIPRRSRSEKVEMERALGDSLVAVWKESQAGGGLDPASLTHCGPLLSAAPRGGHLLTLPGKWDPQTPTSPPESVHGQCFLFGSQADWALGQKGSPRRALWSPANRGGHLYLVCEKKWSRKRKTIIQRAINTPGFFLELWIWKWRFH